MPIYQVHDETIILGIQPTSAISFEFSDDELRTGDLDKLRHIIGDRVCCAVNSLVADGKIIIPKLERI